MWRPALLVFALALAACSDSPAGSSGSGQNPPLATGTDEFMKTYGGVESGVGTAGTKSEEKKSEEKK